MGWTCGFDACQWRFLFSHHNVTDWTLVSWVFEYNRITRTFETEIYLIGFRFWLCIGG
jgi:hypothetical protein